MANHWEIMASTPGFSVARARTSTIWPLVLLLAYLAFTFIGTHPMADTSAGARADGDVVDRIASISLFMLAGALLWSRPAIALTAARRNLGLFAIIAFCVLSILWSNFPALTLRRGVLVSFLAVIAFAIAVTTDDVRQLHTRLFVAMTAIVVVNILATLAFPGRAISALGVQGIYTQKNVAGAVAMIAAIVAATWAYGASDARSKALAALALIPILGFLIATRSKTSINLAAAGLLVVFLFALVERFRAPVVLMLIVGASVALTAGLVWLAANDFDVAAATAAAIGDASFTGRDELWAFVRRDAERRFWFGHGYGAYWDVGQGADPLLRAEVGTWLASVETGMINQAHHGYLELWLHIGLPATIAATLVVGARALRGGLAALLGRGSRRWRAFVLCAALILTLNLLHNLTEATFFMRGALFWNFAMLAYFAMSTALHRLREAA